MAILKKSFTKGAKRTKFGQNVTLGKIWTEFERIWTLS